MSLRDVSDHASKWLELLSLDDVPTMASVSEDYAARRMAVDKAKLDAVLSKLGS